MAIIVVGINHRTAPVELRERVAFADADLPDALRRLKDLGVADEAVILSTCNRVEIYAAITRPFAEAATRLREFILEREPSKPAAAGQFYAMSEPDSVKHLFRVASGLDSMVVGETEVLGQVKRAYDIALRHGSTGRVLNRAFQRAFNVAKQIRSQTNIQRGSVSVASVAVDLTERIFSSLGDKTAMVIGAGDTGEKAAKALLSRGVGHLLVTNRSPERALALANALGGQALPYGDWQQAFARIDIVITSTSAPDYILDRSRLGSLMRERQYRPLLLIDMGVPRNIDPEVALMENVFLYNIDDLQGIANDALRQRQEEIARCEALILDKLRDLLSAQPNETGQSSGLTACFDS
ncbi:MAG: glutamyl-tRNA reductase [Verrucomicrobiota bacterium]|nr:glutamyl-tRNA reductase [Verrucomicrobiota bacterium]